VLEMASEKGVLRLLATISRVSAVILKHVAMLLRRLIVTAGAIVVSEGRVGAWHSVYKNIDGSRIGLIHLRLESVISHVLTSQVSSVALCR
jgi:hypothetical protein